jgi:tRNA-specific 2-thiouridylase
LLEWARKRGADYVATGHYARIAHNPSSGAASLLRGIDRRKDQSYFLFDLSQEQLASTLFPLGKLHKEEVRRRARRLGLPVAERPESQDICFNDYKGLVESCAQGNDLGRGEVVDRSGQVLGYHQGIHRHTIGQRRGLGVAASHPLYVLELDKATKRVVVGGKDELSCTGLVARSVHWIEPPDGEAISAEVQIRYRSPVVTCRILPGEQGNYEVRFQNAFPSVTPGQAAVFYRGDRVLGGGWIEKAISEEAVSNQL